MMSFPNRQWWPSRLRNRACNWPDARAHTDTHMKIAAAQTFSVDTSSRSICLMGTDLLVASEMAKLLSNFSTDNELIIKHHPHSSHVCSRCERSKVNTEDLHLKLIKTMPTFAKEIWREFLLLLLKAEGLRLFIRKEGNTRGARKECKERGEVEIGIFTSPLSLSSSLY